jgi:hypothetical protein
VGSLEIEPLGNLLARLVDGVVYFLEIGASGDVKGRICSHENGRMKNED